MQRLDLTLDQGATFTKNFTFQMKDGTPIDLTGCTAKLSIKDKPGGATTLVTLTSSPAAGITITALSGLVVPRIEASVTTGFPAGVYAWDLKVVNADGLTVGRPIGGALVVTAQVTV